MINPQEMRLQKILDAVEALGIHADERELIEDYLQGEKEEKDLEQITCRDLSNLSEQDKKVCRDVINYFKERQRYAELQKILNIVFAIGHSSCSAVVGYTYVFRKSEFREQCGLDDAKCAAICADEEGHSNWLKKSDLQFIYEVAGSSCENIFKAVEYCNGKTANAKLLLYTIYLWKKHTKVSGMVAKIFESKETKAVLKEMERIIAGNVDKVLVSGGNHTFMTDEWKKELREEVASGKISAKTRNQIMGVKLDTYFIKLLGGCAFINYEFSPVLHAFVTLCIAASMTETLNALVEMDCRSSFLKNGYDFDDIFFIEPSALIEWTVRSAVITYHERLEMNIAKNILKKQFYKNQQAYLECQKKAEFEQSNLMLEIVKNEDKSLYQSLVDDGEMNRREQLIQRLVDRISLKNEATAYLRGEKTLEEMYLIENNLSGGFYGGSQEWEALEKYTKCYGNRVLFNRTLVLMSLCGMGYFFRQALSHITKNTPDVFKSLQEGGLDIAHQLNTFVFTMDTFYSESDKNRFLDGASPVFLAYLKEKPDETKIAFANSGAYGRYFGLYVMEQQPEYYKKEILGFVSDSSKQVKQKLLEILKKKLNWREDITALLSSKKAAEREIAISALAEWNQPEDIEALKKHLETEKSAKLRTLLDKILDIDSSSEGEGKVSVLTLEDLVKNLHKGGKKRSLAWAYETPFSEVHKKNGEIASEEYLQAILLCYNGMSTVGISQDANVLAAELNETEFALYVNELFDKWLGLGAEAKKRFVMYVSSVFGGSDIVKKLHHQIQEWPQEARGAIAADAVQALALNPEPQSLLIVDGIARKFKFKQVKAAAGKALEFAAAQLGLTREELEDKIVPDLGFDENMERHFDYGERSFTVTITPSLEMEIFDSNNKKVKNLPAPAKKDDEEKATAAYQAFKEMKKQMKTTISSQKMRLEQALSSERLWSVEAWQNLFVKNPIMHQFAIGLIWGVYEEHKLVQSFRYMEDGSFNTEDEDEYTLPEQGMIGLVHPIELSKESKDAWKEQLSDYEITQPIEQLEREIFYRTEEEEQEEYLERFGGMFVNDLSLNGKLIQLGWYRGSVQDAGCFDTYYREDTGIGLGVELHFSGTYVACEGDEITIYEARFYKAGTITRGSYCYDEAKGDKVVALKDVPERYFSEIVLQLMKATASSTERDANWKK